MGDGSSIGPLLLLVLPGAPMDTASLCMIGHVLTACVRGRLFALTDLYQLHSTYSSDT